MEEATTPTKRSAHYPQAAALLLLLLPALCAAASYSYPASVTLNLECELPAETLDGIARHYSDADAGPSGVARATAVDLNQDGECEIFLDEPAIYEGNGNESTLILIRSAGQFMPSGEIQWTPRNWWYGEFSHGYPRIFVATYDGHRTNPRLVTDVYAFDGEKYVIEFDSAATHGYYLDEGFKAYRAGDHAAAAQHYQNAYRMREKPTLSDANNLALVWWRLGRIDEAQALLESHLAQAADPEQSAAAHFNLGLIAEQRGDRTLALHHYLRADKLKSTKARRAKVLALQGKEVPATLPH